jgi:hypothetical protein
VFQTPYAAGWSEKSLRWACSEQGGQAGDSPLRGCTTQNQSLYSSKMETSLEADKLLTLRNSITRKFPKHKSWMVKQETFETANNSNTARSNDF